MNLNMIIILSNIFSSSSSVASLFPARSFESTYFATESKSKLVNFCLDPTSFKFSNKPSIIGGKSFVSWPMSSAGLFGRLLIKVSKASFMPLTNFSFFMKHTSMMWSTLSLKSKSSWTIVLSFSGLMTIVLPKAWDTTNKTCDIEWAHSERLWWFSQSSRRVPCTPWCTRSSAAEAPARLPSHDWRAGTAETDPEYGSHPAGYSNLQRDKKTSTYVNHIYFWGWLSIIFIRWRWYLSEVLQWGVLQAVAFPLWQWGVFYK